MFTKKSLFIIIVLVLGSSVFFAVGHADVHRHAHDRSAQPHLERRGPQRLALWLGRGVRGTERALCNLSDAVVRGRHPQRLGRGSHD